ncbi:MAG: hypothetical protein II670_11100, partial [Alphaproteobacteria bacterium]|nr:hypothetical protein [Alphaproteobacteria bacterium]
LWLSVDPMAYKYPGISPYAYCAWNPIKYVDPSGKTWETEDDKRKANQMVESSEKKIKELKLSQAELQETLKSNTLSESRRLNEEYKLSEIENQIELLSDFIKGNQCLILIHQ